METPPHIVPIVEKNIIETHIYVSAAKAYEEFLQLKGTHQFAFDLETLRKD